MLLRAYGKHKSKLELAGHAYGSQGLTLEMLVCMRCVL